MTSGCHMLVFFKHLPYWVPYDQRRILIVDTVTSLYYPAKVHYPIFRDGNGKSQSVTELSGDVSAYLPNFVNPHTILFKGCDHLRLIISHNYSVLVDYQIIICT